MGDESTSALDGALQFDRAELPSAEGLSCRACKTPISETYFTANGVVLCPRCRETIAAARSNVTFTEFLRAAAFGFGAAVAGAIVWGGIRTYAHLNLGLIAVAVGVMIGRAVRAGSNNKGGWLFQAMAILLTYVCIALSFIPEALQLPLSKSVSPASAVVLYWFAVVVTTVISPVLAMLDSILGALIYGFAFWEAWKINKRNPVNFLGPLRAMPFASNVALSPVPEVAAGG